MVAVTPRRPQPAAQAVLRDRTTSGGRLGRRRAPYLFIAPLLLVFTAFYIWPAVQTTVSSLFRWSLLRPWRAEDPAGWDYVGLRNYRETLTSADFWNAAFNSFVWLVVFPLLVTGFSLLVAILVWQVRHGSGLLRTVFILPLTISLTASGVIWSFVYNPDPEIGVLNAVLRTLHLDGSLDLGPVHLRAGQWLSDPGRIDLGFVDLRLANLALIVAAFWAFTGFGVITLTAGLSTVPDELLDCARVDGCRPAQVARYVLVPLLRKPVIIVYVVSVIFALRTFDIVFVMTGGGPAQDTMVLALLLWQQAFAFLTSPAGGTAAAIAVLMSAVLVVIAYPYLRGMVGKGAR